MFINYMTTDELQWKFLKIVLSFYWVGVILLAITNMVIYDNFHDWLRYYNNYAVLVAISTVSTLGAIAYALKKLG